MIGMKTNLKEILEIAQTTSDPKTKLQARAIAVDCYKYIMEMTTGAAGDSAKEMKPQTKPGNGCG
jgi:hypothetical protein